MSNSFMDVTIFIFAFLAVGFIARELIKPLRSLYIPSSVIGGLAALILGPQVIGIVPLPETLSSIPSPMINIVLTAMIMGTVISKSKVKAYASVANLISFTYFSQLVVGTLLGILLATVWQNLPSTWGVMGVFSFWGGHGAAAASGAFFQQLGVDENFGIGMIFATLGLILAIVFGMIIVNIGLRSNKKTRTQEVTSNDEESKAGFIAAENQKPFAYSVVPGSGINSFALQIAIIMSSILLGAFLFRTLATIIPGVSNVPSLLYGMVGAAIIWSLLSATKLDGYVDKGSINAISGVALEICIVSAIATINLELFTSFLAPILIYALAIVALMSIIFITVGKRWVKRDWFETNLIVFGQGIGSTPTGFTLARSVDPAQKTTAWEAFGVSLGGFVMVSSTLVAIIPVLAVNSLVWVIALGVAGVTFNVIVAELILAKRK